MIIIIILWKVIWIHLLSPYTYNWRIYWYYFHSMFSFSCWIGNIFEPYGILILWALLDYQMSQLTVLDRNQIMRICKTRKKLRTFWCYGVPAIPSLSFLQLVKKNHTSGIMCIGVCCRDFHSFAWTLMYPSELRLHSLMSGYFMFVLAHHSVKPLCYLVLRKQELRERQRCWTMSLSPKRLADQQRKQDI